MRSWNPSGFRELSGFFWFLTWIRAMYRVCNVHLVWVFSTNKAEPDTLKTPEGVPHKKNYQKRHFTVLKIPKFRNKIFSRETPVLGIYVSGSALFVERTTPVADYKPDTSLFGIIT